VFGGDRVSLLPSTVRVRLDLLGGFTLHCRGEPVPVSPAGQRLLAYLALQRRPAPRGVTAATLWPEGTDAQATANLRSTLRRLPRAQEVALVTAGPRHLSLPPWVGVDLWQAQDLLRDLHAAHVDAAPAVLQGDLLPDWDADWLDVEREHHRQRRLHALERLCRRHREAGDYERAITTGLAAVGGEPLRETAQRELIEVYLAEGNLAEALRQYQSYRQRLRDELGLAPSPAIRALVAPLLGRPADIRRSPQSTARSPALSRPQTRGRSR
jgi:DNA-binding SARP family transcriptional activator